MKVGDLVKYVQAFERAYKSGIVIRLGNQKVSVFWPDGNITFPTKNSLEVISEKSF